MLSIYPLPALTDNYIWVIHENQRIWIVDPGDSTPVINHIKEAGLELQAILLTHQHPDHCQGVPQLISHWPVPVYAPHAMPEPIAPFITQALAESDQLILNNYAFTILKIPGHTQEHIAYWCADLKIAFVGDTLFGAGCGRAFYSVEDLYRSLQRLKALPPDTRLYCGHEYTLANLAFAQAAEPDNEAIAERLIRVRKMRAEGRASLPSILQEELKTNPFLRLDKPLIKKSAEMASKSTINCELDVFSALRSWKNRY